MQQTEGYIPPELLLGAQSYGPEVDMYVQATVILLLHHSSSLYHHFASFLVCRWGIGCIFAELMLRKPFMGGPFRRGGHTNERVSDDARERLRFRSGQVRILYSK